MSTQVVQKWTIACDRCGHKSPGREVTIVTQFRNGQIHDGEVLRPFEGWGHYKGTRPFDVCSKCQSALMRFLDMPLEREQS
jgi:hypothetical protein